MKKILFVGKYLDNFVGGAEKSMLTLLSSVSNEYHIEAVTFDNTRPRKSCKINNIIIHNYHIIDIPYFRFFEFFLNQFRIKKILKQYKNFDIYISQAFGAAYYVKIIMTLFKDAKTIYFVRDEINLNIFENYEVGFKKLIKKIKDVIELFFIQLYKKKNEFALYHSTEVIANSKFMRFLIRELFHLKSTVIYPLLEIENKSNNIEKREYITLLDTSTYKGIDIFLKIAKKLPNEKFCILGKYTIKNRLPNVRFFRWTQNIDKIYEKTKILLLPSKWREAFGRTVIEALCNYIPVVSSNRGGLIESNINTALIINNIYDIDMWINTIKKVILDYKKYVQNIDLNKLDKFKKNKQIKKFKDILENIG